MNIFSRSTGVHMSQKKSSKGIQQTIALEKLYFDPKNPRLPGGKRTADEQIVLQWMLQNGDLPELMRSIASNGYSDAEPLLVTPTNDGFIVVEGNRRLAALKLLYNPSLATLRRKTIEEIAENAKYTHITDIPVILYEKRRDILDYLGFRHITGVKPWGPREKAEYLKQLFEMYKDAETPIKTTLSLISEMIGTKPYYAKRLLDTLTVVEWGEENAFWGNESVAQNIDSNFSVIHTALSYSDIRNYIGLPDFANGETDSLKDDSAKYFFDWICGKNKKIQDSRELKKLDRVISNAEALSMLERGYSLDEASEYSGEVLEDFRNFMQIAAAKIQEADRLLSRIENFDKIDEDNAQNLAKIARKIFKYIREELENDDDLDF